MNNKVSSDYGQIDKDDISMPNDGELCLMEYEVYVPEDFPSEEWGIISPEMSFSVSNIGGGGIPSADGTKTYIGLSSMETLETEEDPKYEVGNTYSFRELYIMVKGYEDYVFNYTSYPEGTTETSSDIMYYVYHSAN